MSTKKDLKEYTGRIEGLVLDGGKPYSRGSKTWRKYFVHFNGVSIGRITYENDECICMKYYGDRFYREILDSSFPWIQLTSWLSGNEISLTSLHQTAAKARELAKKDKEAKIVKRRIKEAEEQNITGKKKRRPGIKGKSERYFFYELLNGKI